MKNFFIFIISGIAMLSLYIIAMIATGYFMTYGYELYYELNGEYEVEQPLDYTSSNPKVSAEVHYDYSNNRISYSTRLLHSHDEDGYS